MRTYQRPTTTTALCEGHGPDRPYYQNKKVCFSMSKHAGRWGCSNCPSKPWRLAVRVTSSQARRGAQIERGRLSPYKPGASPREILMRLKHDVQRWPEGAGRGWRVKLRTTRPEDGWVARIRTNKRTNIYVHPGRP